MLKKLELANYRCFEFHEVELHDEAILVGKNNAGKSTIIEALRLLSIICSRYRSITYKNAPHWTGLPIQTKGIFPDINGIEFNFDTVRHRYSDATPMIKAIFNHGERAIIYVGEKEIFAILMDANGTPIRNKAEALKITFPSVKILPQLGPLLKRESKRTSKYVIQSMSSHLASSHFRNQLLILSEHFNEFKEQASETWPGLQILDGISIENSFDENQKELNQLLLHVRDGDFVAEVAEMGHGLQMWLQIIWFLSLITEESIVVLDEPDVYMHAELQRKLIRFLRNRYNQIIIATHSIEIIAEVEPRSILIINKFSNYSKYANSTPAVQRIIEGMGTVHNIQLTKLGTAKKCLFVEGEDFKVLSALHNKLYPKDLVAFDSIPNMDVQGRKNWSYSIGSTIINNHLGEVVKVYCIIDRDYYSNKDVQKQLKRAKEFGVELHTWERKEIENYLLIPSAFHRVIHNELNMKTSYPTVDEVEMQLLNIIDSMYDNVFDALSENFYSDNRSEGVARAMNKARNKLREMWTSADGKISVISGKTVISEMSRWAQENYKVSFSTLRLAWELKVDEIPSEVKNVINSICLGEPLLNVNENSISLTL